MPPAHPPPLPPSPLRFVGGDVYKSKKLSTGQGTLYCMGLCR